MGQTFQWASGLIVVLTVSGSPVLAQQHGHQQMMMPRVPADKLAEARALVNPLPPSPDIVEQGKVIYEGKGGCVNCHGASGRGDGPGAATLNPPPRVFRSHGFWNHRSEGEIFWVIKYGSPGTGMIPFGGMLSDEEIWTVMQYERSFSGGPHGGGPQGGGRHQGRGMMQHQSRQEGYGAESGVMAMADQQVDSGQDVMDKAEKAKAASIGIAQAIAAANKHVPGTVLEAEFEVEANQAFWEVEIVTDEGTVMEVKVDSHTGAILSSEEEKPEDGQKPMRHGKGYKHQGSKDEHECCEGEGQGMGGGHMGGGHMKGGGMKGHMQE